MARKSSEKYDNRIIEALQKLPKQIEDKRHGFVIEVEDDRARSNETRFQHIAKKEHLLKARDIEAIPEGIKNYIKRKFGDKGFIQVAVITKNKDKKKAYIKTAFITYRIK